MSGGSLVVAWLVIPLAVYWLAPALGAVLGVRFEGRAGNVVVNYRGRDVPLGLGWAWLALGVAWTIVGAAGAMGPMPGALVAGAALLGWLDDRFGGDGPKGFRGHLRALRERRVTTGLVKLVGMVLLALAAAEWITPASLWPTPAAAWVLEAAVIALTANLVNLLDLRPGRALKAYLVLVLPVALANALVVNGVTIAPARLAVVAAVAMGPAVVCLPFDLRERAMLGDMGANAAGALAGWVLVQVLGVHAVGGGVPLLALALLAAVLLAVNLASERVSFSAVIERNRVLRWLDRLGRGGGVPAEDRTPRGETGT